MTVILPRNDHISRISPKKGNWFWTSTVSTGWDMWSFLQDELSHFACTWILLGWTFLEVAWRPPQSALWIGHVLRSQEGAEAAAQEIFGWMVVFSASKLDQPICSFRVAMSSDEDHSEQWPIRISWNVIRALNVAPVFFSWIFPVFFFTFSNLDERQRSRFAKISAKNFSMVSSLFGSMGRTVYFLTFTIKTQPFM